ncbi:RrF2 family transcriptional regulator [Candidatus Omnitrophota bacterium]
MKFSKKSRYGVRAMAELALYYKEKPMSAKVIAKSQRIPLQYLEQIFNILKKAGLICTVRGPKGGYSISRSPSRIKLKDIMYVLENKRHLADCLTKKGANSCDMIENCLTRTFWEKLDKAVSGVLNSTTLMDLCKKAKKRKDSSISHSYLFQI